MLLTAVLGLLLGLAPTWTVLVVGGVAAVSVLLWRVELAALAVVVGSLLDDQQVDHLPPATTVLVVVLVASWAVRRARGPLHDGNRSRVTDAVVSFLVVLLVATLVHPNGPTGLDVLLRYVGFVAVTLVLIEVFRGQLRPQRAALAYVRASTLASLLGLATLLDRGETPAVGVIANPDDLAFSLLAAVPLALVLRRDRRRGWLLDVALVLLLLAIVATLSRGAIFALVAMLLVATLTRLLSVPAIMSVVATLLIASSIALIAVPDLVRTGLDQKELVAAQNVSERLALWQSATTMTLENPVLGLGPGSFSLSHLDYRTSTPDDVAVTVDVAQSTWLEASAELGLLGLLALVGMLVAGFGAAWTRWRRDREPLAAGVCVALVGAAVAATFGTDQYLLPLWLLVALGAALNADDTPRAALEVTSR